MRGPLLTTIFHGSFQSIRGRVKNDTSGNLLYHPPVRSTATFSGRFTAKSGNPAVNDIGGTAAPIIRIDIDSINWAILRAGATLHAPIYINDLSFTISNQENAVGADLFTVAATDAQFFIQP